MWGYGLLQGSAAPGDSLVLFFGAAVLGLSPALIGVLDVASSISFTGGAFGLAFLIPRLRHGSNLFVLSIAGVGLTFLLFAAVNTVVLAMAMAVAFGLLLAPSAALAPVMASAGVSNSQRSEAFSQLNRVASVCGAVGMVVAAVWLAATDRLWPSAMGMRLLFVGVGMVAIVGALWTRRCLAAGGRHRESLSVEHLLSSLPQEAFTGSPRRSLRPFPAASSRRWWRRGTSLRRCGPPGPSSESRSPRAALPFLSDQFLYYLAFSFVLFAGMGMSFTGVHAYLVQDLRASVALAMGGLLGFKLASYLVSRPFSQGMAQLLPLQAQSLTSLGRGMAVAAVAAVGVSLPAQWAMPVVLVLVALWGVSGGALAVTGAEVTARLAVPGRWKESMALYVGVSNAGGIAGVLLGGMMASLLGFEAMFLVSAGLTSLAALLLLRN